MSMLSDNSKRYGLISQVLHWGVAALTIGAYITGEVLVGAVDDAKTNTMYWHASLSILVVGFFAIRAAWRLSQTSPDELNQRKLEVLAHKLVVLALYALPVLLTITGVVSILAAGQAVDFFALDFLAGWTVADSELSQLLEEVHIILAHAVITVFGLHTVAALWHQFVRRDGVLSRMLPISLRKS